MLTVDTGLGRSSNHYWGSPIANKTIAFAVEIFTALPNSKGRRLLDVSQSHRKQEVASGMILNLQIDHAQPVPGGHIILSI